METPAPPGSTQTLGLCQRVHSSSLTEANHTKQPGMCYALLVPTHGMSSSGSSGRLETAHTQPALALQEARHSCPPVWGTTSPQKVPSPCWGLPKSSLRTGWARGVVLLGWTHGNMIQKYCHFREKRKVWEELYGRVSNRFFYPVPHLP